MSNVTYQSILTNEIARKPLFTFVKANQKARKLYTTFVSLIKMASFQVA
jgi:hypothetical protein